MKIKQDPVGIGPNLKRLRQKAGYSQSQFVKLLQQMSLPISIDIYKKMEQNRYNIRINELIAMKEILDVDFNELFRDLAFMRIDHTAE